jgi:hypothetical protein
LLRKFRLQYPQDRPARRWSRIYPLAIPNFATMSELEQVDARQQLRERVRWRLRDRKGQAFDRSGRDVCLAHQVRPTL